MLANAYGHESGVAEYVIGAILALTREFFRLDRALRRRIGGVSGRSASRRLRRGPNWQARRLGYSAMVGSGRASLVAPARSTCRSARSAAMWGNPPKDDLVRLGSAEMLEEVLRQSDYVVVSMPATIGWIVRERFRLMKPSAFLINVARAEMALYQALSERQIAGAALDVWYRYLREAGSVAPASHSFHELPNVLMTPHVSGWTDGTLDARARLIAENIRRVATGEVPLNLVSP
jgi:phosphoglycerate dehydrogenase-like enzyme